MVVTKIDQQARARAHGAHRLARLPRFGPQFAPSFGRHRTRHGHRDQAGFDLGRAAHQIWSHGRG
jgi:hypothetical protein